MIVRRRAWLVLALILLILMPLSFANELTTESVSGRVMMISAYSPGYETFYEQVDGIRAVFSGHDIQFDLEFMDTKRFFEEENIEIFYDYLAFKLERLEPYDVILAADDNALDFVIEHKESLFPTQAIVFLGINNVDKGIELSKRSDVTGVLEEATIRDTIDLALSFNQTAERVILITDQTTTAKTTRDGYYRQSDHYPDMIFDEFELGNYSFDEMDQFLSRLGEKDIVLLSSALRDKNNVSITFGDSLQRIIKHCNQPVYHLYEFGMGDGIIGGHLVRYFSQGEEAAKIALAILSGEPVENIQLVENANRVMIDYDVLSEFGIDEDLAPADTIWINKKISIWEEYFWYIILGVFILLLQTTFIVVLQLNVRRRKTVERELTESKANIQQSNEELRAFNEELRVTNEELGASYAEIEQQKQKINDLIYIDPLTSLRNRYGITEEITNCINSDCKDKVLAVMFLDVDNFKDINDTFGHDIGDEAIEQTGERLKRIECDTIEIGRFGGDEFLIFIKGEEQVNRLESIIKDIQECFEDVIIIGDKSFFFTVSLGVALYPEHAETKKDLIKKADMALYEAKFSGKNKYVIYEKNMDKALEDKVLFQTLVREGYENNEFYMNYQPYFDTDTKRVIGFEALIRWHSESLGMVSPYNLITTAEEMGLIIDIGKWIFRESCEFAKRINEKTENPITVSVNVSGVQIVKVDFYSMAVSVVEEVGIDPNLICLEMTETVLIEGFSETQNQIHKLKEYGFVLALDDFGTGYSSLSYFKNIPADILKIDKSFVDHMATDSYDKYTVEAIINLAHYNGLQVTAEGVEVDDQEKLLNQMSCDVIQGYYYSKPLSEIDALNLISDAKMASDQ